MTDSNNINKSLITTVIGLVLVVLIAVMLLAVSPADRLIAIRTILLGLFASAIALPVGALIAWVCLGNGIVSRLVLVANIALLLVPLLVHVSGWDAAFGKLGWLTNTRGQVLVPLVSGWTAAVWIHGIAAAPQVAVILLIGLSTGKRVHEEQALLDTSHSGVFWSVTIHRIWPLSILSVIWIVVSCAREIAVTDLYQIGTLAEQIYLGYSLGVNSIAGTWTPEQLLEAGSVGAEFTILLIACVAAAAFLLFFHVTDLEHESEAFLTTRSVANSFGKAFAGSLLILFMVVVPIGNVILRACFFVRPINGIPTQGYSIEQLFRSLRRAGIDYRDEFVWSFLIATVSASMIVVLATLFAARSRRGKWVQFVFALTLAICCALPGPYIGTIISGILSVSQNNSLYWLANYTIFAPVLANFVFCWPVGALVIWFVFRKIANDTLESAKLDGAGKWARFFQFGIRQNFTAIAGCWFISFAFCFGELSASQIVRPAGIDTVPRKMLGDLHAGVDELTAGITIITTTLIVAVSLAGWSLICLNQIQNRRKYERRLSEA